MPQPPDQRPNAPGSARDWRSAMSVHPLPDDPRPIIDIGEYDPDIHKPVVKLLLAKGQIYKHRGELVEILVDYHGARPSRISPIILRYMISEVARFRKIDGRSGKWKMIAAPSGIATKILVKAKYEIGELPFPEYVEGGATCPD
jgi:hypothetical protein